MARGFRLFIYTIAILTWSLVPCTTMHATSFNGKQQTDDIEAMLGNETTFMAIQLDKNLLSSLGSDAQAKYSAIGSWKANGLALVEGPCDGTTRTWAMFRR